MIEAAVVLAHQGGWDEVVLVILPLVVLGILLFLARRRAVADAEREAGAAGDAAPESHDARRPPPAGM